MKPVRMVAGTMVSLPQSDVDTDQIIPKQFLTRTERSGYGDCLFFDWARTADGTPTTDFFTHDPSRAGAKVLLAGRNFGCGSSREHAVWAIQDWGLEAVIAPSFGDIFRNNSVSAGLLTVELPEDQVNRLHELATDPTQTVFIDLERQVVEADGATYRFEFDPDAQNRLLNGLDPVGVTLTHEDAIAAYEARRPAWLG